MKEPHKIHLRREVWSALTSIAEREGTTLDDLIARLLNDRYAWGIPEPPTDQAIANTPSKHDIRTRLKELIQSTYLRSAPRSEYIHMEVWYCTECHYIAVVSRYSVYPRVCPKEHHMALLGTLNNFI